MKIADLDPNFTFNQTNSLKVMAFYKYKNTFVKKPYENYWGWAVKGNKIYQFWSKEDGKPKMAVMDNNDFNYDAMIKKQEEKKKSGFKPASSDEWKAWVKPLIFKLRNS